MIRFKMGLRGAAKAAYMKTRAPLDMRRLNHAAMVTATMRLHNEVVRWGFGGHVVRVGQFIHSAPGNQLANRDGAARSRINQETFVRGNTMFGVVGSPDKYILTNEVGATITAKGKALAIPMAAAQTPTGRMKAEFAGMHSWRDIKGIFVMKTKRGSAFLARKAAGMKKAKPEKLALLRTSVNIPARHMMRTSLKRATPDIVRILGRPVAATFAAIGRVTSRLS